MVLEGSAVPVAVLGHDEALTVARVVAPEAAPMAWAVAVGEAGPVAWAAARAVVLGCSAVPLAAPAASRAGLMAVGPVPSRSFLLRFVSWYHAARLSRVACMTMFGGLPT